MSGHGWVTPNPDGSKARCGGPGICPACSSEMIMEKRAAEMADLDVRERSAIAALNQVGLYLLKPGYGGYVVTDKPGDDSETVVICPTLEHVEKFVAEWTAPGTASAAAPLKPIESQPYIGAPVHYVSYGTPGGEYGKECRAAWVTELTEVEVNEQNPAGDGIFRQTVGLFVANPNGTFHNRGVLYDPGTFRGPARGATPGEPLPIITCADLDFAGGTWHWPAHS
jgi:hypothetical protein